MYAKVIKEYECYKMMYFLNITQNFTILNFACYSKFYDFKFMSHLHQSIFFN